MSNWQKGAKKYMDKNKLILGVVLVFAALVAGFSLNTSALTVTNSQAVIAQNLEITNLIYNPYPVLQGSRFTAYIQLYNFGNSPENNINFTLLPNFPFSLQQGESASRIIPEISPSGNALITYDLYADPTASDGNNPIDYQISVNGQTIQAPYSTTLAGQSQQSYFSFNVSIIDNSHLIVSSVTPTILQPGNPQPLVFTLTNAGNATIHSVFFNWNEPTSTIVPVGTSNGMFIPYIDPGVSKNISFMVVANPSATPGTYSLTDSYNYENGNTSISNTTTNGILVGGPSQIEVDVQGYSAGSLSLTISNVGNNPASAVSVTLPKQNGIAVTGGSSATFLGNLLKGDFTVATFPVVAGQGSNNGNLSVIIAYTDTLGNRNTQTEQVPFDFSVLGGGTGISGGFSRNRPSSPINLVEIVVVVIILAGAAYWYFFKRAKKKA